MRRFTFSADEIDNHKSDRRGWHNFVRRREAEMAFSLLPNRRFEFGLELGAGDGGQSVTISKHCDRLICTEKDEQSHAWLGQSILKRQLPNVEYSVCDAQDLSRYSDNTFDLVFSSNVLEHIADVDLCLSECRRVLRSDGLMLHTMPSRWWKVFNAGVNVIKLRPPGIHGVCRTQYREFMAFGLSVWRRRIESQQLTVTDTIGLPFYVGHGNSFIPIVKYGNKCRLSGSYLYIIRKKH